MSNIEVGEYVRTKYGYIAKLKSKDDTFLYFDNTIYNYYEESPLLPIELKMLDGTYIRAEDYIIKHSKNIIDLIGLGDCLKIKNDEIYQVIFDESYEKLGILIPNKNELAVRHCSINYIFSKEGIKKFEKVSIVTKEQFKEMEYRVDE